jgi:hypothetical protein
MDKTNIQHLVDFIKNNTTYTAGELAGMAVRTGYTHDEFKEAMRFIEIPSKKLPPGQPNINVEELIQHERTIAVQNNTVRKKIHKNTTTISYIEVAVISLTIFAVTFGGLYCYSNGVPPPILALLGLR